VEYGYITQLLLLLDNLDYLTSISDEPPETQLLLRKCNPYAYTLAREHGFRDEELEKRIILLQRVFRKQPLPDLTPFTGPEPEVYENEDRYWGYRHALYYLRWNRKRIAHFLKLFRDPDGGDCRMAAYDDFMNGREIDLCDPGHYAYDSETGTGTGTEKEKSTFEDTYAQRLFQF
jgi:hypothetical protein